METTLIEQADFAHEVFQIISDRFVAKAVDIAVFTRTQYSFEEWLNWEAYTASCSRNEWSVAPKPCYSKITVEDCKDYGDLLVTGRNPKLSVLVEVGLVHDGTGDKWLDKLDRDSTKLSRRLNSGIIPLQIIVLVSSSPIQTAKNWGRWLARLKCWNRPNNREVIATLPPRGEMIIRGWTLGFDTLDVRAE